MRAFQKVRVLAVDGIVGPKTHGALYQFVRLRNHLIVPPTARERGRGVRFGVGGGDDVPRLDPILPPIGPLELRFPDPFRPPGPPTGLLGIPALTLGNSVEFEVAVGLQRTIARNLSANKPDSSTSVFSDLQGTFWRRPVGKHVELSLGAGVFLERDVGVDPKTSVRVGILAKAELKDVVKIGPLDLLKLIVEHKNSTSVNGPVDFNSEVEVGVNPTVEVNVAGHRVEFGPKFSKFFEIGIGKDHFEIKSGSTLTAGTLSVFF